MENDGHGHGDEEREHDEQQIEAAKEAVDVTALGSIDLTDGHLLAARTGVEGDGAVDAHGADEDADGTQYPYGNATTLQHQHLGVGFVEILYHVRHMVGLQLVEDSRDLTQERLVLTCLGNEQVLIG